MRWDSLAEAEIAVRLDEVEAAEHLFTEALKTELEPIRRGRAMAGLGQIAFREGQVDRAIDQLQEALELLGDSAVEHSAAGITLGRAFALRGEFAGAIAVYERMMELARRVADRASEDWYAVSLANILIDRGNL